VGGGVYGGIKKGVNAIPESTATAIETALTHAIGQHDLQADLRQSVLRYTGNMASGLDLGVGAEEPAAPPDYMSMAGRGVGAVLELSLTQLAFEGARGWSVLRINGSYGMRPK
jgi:hypothetical protein